MQIGTTTQMPASQPPNSSHTQYLPHRTTADPQMSINLFRFSRIGQFWIFQFQEDINFSFVTRSNYFENLRQHVRNSLRTVACHWPRLGAWLGFDQWERSSCSLLCSVNIVVCQNSGKISRRIGIPVAASSMSIEADVEFLANSLDFSVNTFLQAKTNRNEFSRFMILFIRYEQI